jgi:uncharacterized protein DUF3303
VEGPPASYKEAIGRFLKTGGPPPAGLKTIGRWHAAGLGFHLVEGTEAALIEHAAEWADLLEIQIAPVVEDAEAGAVASKLFGK